MIPTWLATPPPWTCIYNVAHDPVHQIARGLLQTVGSYVESSNAEKEPRKTTKKCVRYGVLYLPGLLPPPWTCIYNVSRDPVHQIARGLLQTVGTNVYINYP